MEEPGRLQVMGSKESDRTEQLHFHFTYEEIQGLASQNQFLKIAI